MTAKTYLERLTTMSKRIDAKIEQKERLMEQATRATSTISTMPKGTGAYQTFERFIDKIVDMEAAIVDEIDRLADEKMETRFAVELLASSTFREVLTWRYIEMHSVNKIASMMSCDRSTVWRVERDAIDELEKIMGYYGILQRMQHRSVI